MNSTTINNSGLLGGEALARLHEVALKQAVSDFDDLDTWEKVAIRYRRRPDAGPRICVLEGTEAEQALMTAGFRFIAEKKGFGV